MRDRLAVTLDSAARTLELANLGDMTVPGALVGGAPCLVVDLGLDVGAADRDMAAGPDAEPSTGRRSAPALDVDVMFPGVVVAVSRHATHHPGAYDADVALTSDPTAPPPWVRVSGLDASTEQLVAEVARNPRAAVTLVQVLRASSPDRIAVDLALESLAYSALLAGPEFARWLASRPTSCRRTETADPVVAGRDGDALTITLNRPRVHNAFSAAMRDGLYELLSLAAVDPSIRDVHLRGAGPSFSSGGDLGEFGTLPDPVTAHLIRSTRSCARLLARIADRTTAHLHGSCVGAGIELAAIARHVTAEADTTIRLPEIAMGLIPGAGGTASLPRRIGRHRTAWLALSGAPISLGTALDWGLVDAAV